MIGRLSRRSRAFTVLLLFLLLLAPACASPSPDSADRGDDASSEPRTQTAGDRERIEKAAQGELEAGGETDSGEETDRGGTNTTATSAKEPAGTTFVHRAAEENSRGDYTYISDPSIDGDANAAVFAAPTTAEGGAEGGDYKYNIGVWFEPEKQKWAIFNQDRAPVPAGSTFQVTVPPESERFVHRSGPENISGDATYLDDSLVNGKPDARLSVTQNWNPGGGRGVYNDHPVAVRYDEDRERWAVYNEDQATIPDGASFNVTVSAGARATGADVASTDVGEAPEYKDFYSEGDPQTPKLISSDSSAGAIPVVKPFNFGRDPGGPEDKTLSLDIPKIGVQDIPAFDTVSEEKLRDGTVHIPASGYPWQKGANVFVAGHRIGYEGTESYYVFFRLDELREGDEIRLEDAAGDEYLYRVTTRKVVGPNDVEVMNAVEGKSLITLQTCTLPDYEDRLIVQGELVEEQA